MTYADDTLWADQLDELVGLVSNSVALGISCEVSEISYVTDLITWGTVGLAVGVDCAFLYQLNPSLYSSMPVLLLL